MRLYRFSIVCILLFAIAYPLVSGAVLFNRWESGISEIYPVAPWSLFCFVPNNETDYGIRLRSVDGGSIEPPIFFEDYANLTESQQTVGYAIVQEMGQLVGASDSGDFRTQRLLFEQSFLRLLARRAEYELVRREFDVLERWKSGKCEKMEVIEAFDYQGASEGI